MKFALERWRGYMCEEGEEGAIAWVQLQFCSDMHLEMPMSQGRLGLHLRECLAQVEEGVDVDDDRLISDVLPPLAPGNYLALLGDIVNGKKIRDGSYRKYLLKQSIGFQAVFVLAGNHEFYCSEVLSTRAALAKLCSEVTEELGGTPTVHFLDCGYVDLPDTALRVLGCTLWSAVSEENAAIVGGTLNDYSVITVACEETEGGRASRKVTVDDTNAWHARERSWLMGAIAEAESIGRRCVVLTHHGPTFHETSPPQHRDSPAIAEGFVTNLEHMLRPPVSAWLFGHTHWSNWMRFSAGSDEAEGPPATPWKRLTGGPEGGGPLASELSHSGSLCDATRGEVLVASNQLGYGAMGEHTKSRCHPLMLLQVSSDGSQARLCCDGSAVLPD